jgi:exodeoxyribonuclease-3
MKLISYNVNGIRAAITKGFVTWLQEENPDIICIQELKAEIEQVDLKEIFALGYEVYWHSAQKKGYSGVAIFSKIRPNNVSVGCGIDKYDAEGRVLRADYDGFSVMSVYMPSGSSGDERQAFKMDWLADFQNYINALKIEFPNLIISGDYNICHEAIDIHDPIRNQTVSGFLPHISIALWTEWPSATRANTLAFAPAIAWVLGLLPPFSKVIVLSRFH